MRGNAYILRASYISSLFQIPTQRATCQYAQIARYWLLRCHLRLSLLQIDDDAMAMFAQTRSVLSNLRHTLHQPHCVPCKLVWCCKDFAAAAL